MSVALRCLALRCAALRSPHPPPCGGGAATQNGSECFGKWCDESVITHCAVPLMSILLPVLDVFAVEKERETVGRLHGLSPGVRGRIPCER